MPSNQNDLEPTDLKIEAEKIPESSEATNSFNELSSDFWTSVEGVEDSIGTDAGTDVAVLIGLDTGVGVFEGVTDGNGVGVLVGGVGEGVGVLVAEGTGVAVSARGGPAFGWGELVGTKVGVGVSVVWTLCPSTDTTTSSK